MDYLFAGTLAALVVLAGGSVLLLKKLLRELRIIGDLARRMQVSSPGDEGRAFRSALYEAQQAMRRESQELTNAMHSLSMAVSAIASRSPMIVPAAASEGVSRADARDETSVPGARHSTGLSAKEFIRSWVRDRRAPEDGGWNAVSVQYEGRAGLDGFADSSGLQFRPVNRLAEFVCLAGPGSPVGYIYPHPEAALTPEVLNRVYRQVGAIPPQTADAIADTDPIPVEYKDGNWESR